MYKKKVYKALFCTFILCQIFFFNKNSSPKRTNSQPSIVILLQSRITAVWYRRYPALVMLLPGLGNAVTRLW